MDNNNNSGTPPTVAPQTPVQSADIVSPLSTTQPSGAAPLGMPPISTQAVPPAGGSKKGLMLIVLAFAVVAILLAVGGYIYMSAQNSSATKSSEQSSQVTQSLNNLSTEVSNQTIEPIDSDFSGVDQDLKSL